MNGTKKIPHAQIVPYTTADVADSVGKRYQTDNQQAYNDATSSIQTQLGTKQTYLVKDSVPTTAVTGTTSITKIGESITIPANTFSANDAMYFDAFSLAKTGVNGTVAMRIYHNTTDTLTGATSIAVFTSTATALSMKMLRTFEITGGLLKCRLPGTATGITDVFTTTVAGLSISFDLTIDNYFFTTVQLANAADSVVRTQLLILK